jgi:hypothetical protein
MAELRLNRKKQWPWLLVRLIIVGLLDIFGYFMAESGASTRLSLTNESDLLSKKTLPTAVTLRRFCKKQ